jgi:hypothetical protein
MSAQGLYDVSKHTNIYATTRSLKNIASFSSVPHGTGPKADQYSVQWKRNSDGGIAIRASYSGGKRGKEIFEKRVTVLCSEGHKTARSKELRCIGKAHNTIDLISKGPKDNSIYPHCTYSGGRSGNNISEEVTLRKTNKIKTRDITKKGRKKTLQKSR